MVPADPPSCSRTCADKPPLQRRDQAAPSVRRARSLDLALRAAGRRQPCEPGGAGEVVAARQHRRRPAASAAPAPRPAPLRASCGRSSSLSGTLTRTLTGSPVSGSRVASTSRMRSSAGCSIRSSTRPRNVIVDRAFERLRADHFRARPCQACPERQQQSARDQRADQMSCDPLAPSTPRPRRAPAAVRLHRSNPVARARIKDEPRGDPAGQVRPPATARGRSRRGRGIALQPPATLDKSHALSPRRVLQRSIARFLAPAGPAADAAWPCKS